MNPEFGMYLHETRHNEHPPEVHRPRGGHEPKNPQIAAAIARAKAKKLAKLSEPLNTAKLVESSKDKGASEAIIKTTIEPTAADNKKAKIAATIAKAKAKKLAKNVAPSNLAQSTEIIKEQR